jgi:hypothetical protein
MYGPTRFYTKVLKYPAPLTDIFLLDNYLG